MVVGLDIAGIDMISPDITQPLREVGGGIVEVNAGPASACTSSRAKASRAMSRGR